uniref:Probable pectate lyase F n=1 Tax=Ditylenchus dipsaci TaxID=166011 RepID=A0A915E1Q1_9BILA
MQHFYFCLPFCLLIATLNSASADFPAATDCTPVTKTIPVGKGETYDGQNKCLTADPSLGSGNQDEDQKAIILVQDGGKVINVIFGDDGADGIHCKGSCTILNCFWTNVGEDAATFRGGAGSNSVVDGGGAKGADDKCFQMDGGGTVTIKNFECDQCGKLIRSCGNCETQVPRNIVVQDVVVRDLGKSPTLATLPRSLE